MINATLTKRPLNRVIHLGCYFIAAIVLFIPVLDKNFVSDDFVVLRRVCLEGNIKVQGFFRPLSDCSIFLNYLLNGFHPVSFNLTNIFIHAINSFMLFELCLKWKWAPNENLQYQYAIIASILFLTYPFHNEAVVWLLGRGASMAACFGMAALLVFFSGWNDKATIIAVCGFYFMSLLAYESVIILPMIIFVLLGKKKTSFRTYINWALAFFVTGIIHLVLRHEFSGATFGNYGEDLLKTPLLQYPGNIFKVMGRLVIPPITQSRLFLIITIVFTIVICFPAFIKFKKTGADKSFVLKLLGVLACALIIPFMFTVSTRTSESDRLLYFPSVFLCCVISYLIFKWVRSKFVRQIIFISICIYNIGWLELSNHHWFKAGRASYAILDILRSDTGSYKIYIANLPNEINGAYVFREGFKDALIVNKIDTSRIIVINKLSKELHANSKDTWIPTIDSAAIFIPPFVEIKKEPLSDAATKPSEIIYYKLPKGSKLYYWDQHKVVLLTEHTEFF